MLKPSLGKFLLIRFGLSANLKVLKGANVMAVYHDVQSANYADKPAVEDRPAEYHMNVLARLISFIGSLIIALLGLRFLLLLLGANPANAFAHFIYNVSRPFVQPFYSLFNYEPTFTKSHFEVATLVAIVVYALITYLLVKLATIGSRRAATY
jgi:uncharacterized protein YggT (Ycf19 family)